MRCKSYTLGGPPFNFDVPWPFPKSDEAIILDAIESINIKSISDIPSLERELNKSLSKSGYVWDEIDKNKCKLWQPDFNMSVDFYNEKSKIAIEVEKTEVKRIIHDFLKLINGSLTFVPKIKYGVIIYPRMYKRTSGKESIFGSKVVSEVNFYFKHLLGKSELKDILLVEYDL